MQFIEFHLKYTTSKNSWIRTYCTCHVTNSILNIVRDVRDKMKQSELVMLGAVELIRMYLPISGQIFFLLLVSINRMMSEKQISRLRPRSGFWLASFEQQFKLIQRTTSNESVQIPGLNLYFELSRQRQNDIPQHDKQRPKRNHLRNYWSKSLDVFHTRLTYLCYIDM